jgi:predicted RNase H-like nuclease (RuvC/YqgF family)
MPKTEEELAAEAAEIKKAEEQRIADMVNRAAADHTKRAMAKLDKQLEERDQKIAQLEAMLSGGRKEEPATQAATGKDDPSEKRIRELEARMAERDRKIEEERKAREAERAERLRSEERAAASAALSAAEITGELGEAALLRLQAQGRIGRDDAGNVCFLVQKEGYVDKIPVTEGVKAWAESDGRAYLPARGVGGAGTKPPARGAPSPKADTSKGAKIAQAKNDLAKMFFGKSDGVE